MTYILITLVLFIAILGIWISGGGQKANDSIPKKLEGPPFRIYEAGVDCEVYLQKGVPHAFEVMVPKAKISKQLNSAAIRFLSRKLLI